jgi:hypothetical protein
MVAWLSKVPSPQRMMPTEKDLTRIPLARAGEFDLTDKETMRTRRLIYSINRQGQFKYRTQREASLLMVWRIR